MEKTAQAGLRWMVGTITLTVAIFGLVILYARRHFGYPRSHRRSRRVWELVAANDGWVSTAR